VLLPEFGYELPPELIAAQPSEPRDSSRLMVYDRHSGGVRDLVFRDLPSCLRPGDLLVVNDTKVLPHRLVGHRRAGGRVECLVLERSASRCIGFFKPARRLVPGEVLALEDGRLQAMLTEDLGGGRFGFELSCANGIDLDQELARFGRAPLPPYIPRASDQDPASIAQDRERYQTIYARHAGAVAAPTAGLHFTPELLAKLEQLGVQRTSVTLHVGEGTFQPVRCERIEDHTLHAESFTLSADAVAACDAVRAAGGRVVAVGTTVARVLETVADPRGRLVPARGSTALFITPGYRFRAIDALITNFHLPQSTLLMLVAALVGRERLLDLYRRAIAGGYRFYSFGDAMLIE
jgi:S-adenosylmethionine:tRNA ribosyltransferase-isomerase